MNEMKRYVNTVERCLRLDPATRLRVMNDLASDLQSRLEAGETMEQIRAELGGPEQLAAALEAEFAAHRDPAPRWRCWLPAALCAAVLAAEGALAALGQQLVPVLVLSPLTALAGLLLSGVWLAAVLLVLAVRGALKK